MYWVSDSSIYCPFGSTLQQYIKNLAERAVAYLNVDIAVVGTHVQLLGNVHII